MNPFSDEMRRDPYPTYATFRRASPVMQLPGAPIWMVLDYDGVRRALHDAECFSSNVSPTRGLRFEWLLFMDPPRHTHLRAIVSKAFTPRSVAALEPRIRAISGELLDAIAAKGGACDLVRDFATPLPMRVIAEMLGAPPSDAARLTRWSEAIIDLGLTIMGTPEESAAASAAFLAADAEMAAWLDALAPGADDLIARLRAAEVDGDRLRPDEILRFVQLLLAAGTETTTNLIDNAVLALLEHPAELARLRADPALVPSAIEEVLRYRSPAQAMFRATTRDVELGGRTIPAGAFVLAMIGAANRDPAAFAEPDRFDVARDPNPHLAFGHGMHYCLGAPLSRLEGRIALADLLARFGRIARADDAPWPPRRAFHVHGPTRLPMQLDQ
ncbi:MAG TPA: cytochrome P450 [Kofleriaceae bacterium]|nr:cytochrome P450 [Kofleriaceae bacterium]